jgi:hypothetical protein
MKNGGYWISLCCGKPRSNVYRGLWQTAVFRLQIAKKKIFVPRIATAKILNLRADCQGVISVVDNRSTFESGLLRGYSCLGKPRYLSAECHKQLNSSTGTFHFTSAVPLFVAS